MVDAFGPVDICVNNAQEASSGMSPPIELLDDDTVPKVGSVGDGVVVAVPVGVAGFGDERVNRHEPP